MLGAPPPDPPPNVPKLAEEDEVVLSGTLRERMEQHRANPACATCHDPMDPLGFGLENFDAVGAWRDSEAGHPIDASGLLPSGQTFNGPAELRKILLARRDEFCRCLTEKLLTYALGRGLEYYDRCTVEQIGGALAADDYRFSRLVLEIALSRPFLMRRAKGDPP